MDRIRKGRSWIKLEAMEVCFGIFRKNQNKVSKPPIPEISK